MELKSQKNDNSEEEKKYKLGDGNDIGSGSVCFNFHSTNVVQLSMSSKVA